MIELVQGGRRDFVKWWKFQAGAAIIISRSFIFQRSNVKIIPRIIALHATLIMIFIIRRL